MSVSVKVCDEELSSVKLFMDQCHADVNDDMSNVELLLLSADKLPPNQRVELLNLYEEVSDLLKDKHAEVESLIQSVENADSVYEVTVQYCCSIFHEKGT